MSGCGCENTEFGCCLDERTPARGPGKAGCGCESSKYGCCPDAETEAQGEKFEGCKEVPAVPGGELLVHIVNPYPTAFPYGNGMVLHFYQQQESSTTKTVHKVINKGLKA